MQKDKLIKKLHIVSFDVPYPPNYGGVIDVFYKLKKLAEKGVEIYLHTYEYGRGKQVELEKYCKHVFYYSRSNSLSNLFSQKPYIVKTRNSKELVKNLKKDNFPILFEGLHTTLPLEKNDFSDRTILVRAHNIEHKYYKGLKKSETKKSKIIYFESESQKLKKYETVLKKADHILTISPFEQNYFQKKYSKKSTYLPAFFNCEIETKYISEEKFALWHGDLRVSDNCKSALYVISVFSKLKQKLVIASSTENEAILEQVDKYDNVTFENLTCNNKLEDFFAAAHVNTLVTYQKTGIKLKLLNALCKGKFLLVNDLMVEDTGLENVCTIANTKEEFRKEVVKLFNQEFTKEDFEKRVPDLERFDTSKSADVLISLL